MGIPGAAGGRTRRGSATFVTLSPGACLTGYAKAMNAALRHAWTEIVTADDYERHMAAIGQAQAAAELTRHLIASALLEAGDRLVIAGAGTGQVFDFLPAAAVRPYRLVCTDLNPRFLARLRQRLVRHAVDAALLVDDIERTALAPGPGLLLATLLLEHIDWPRGVDVLAGLRPRACGIVLQENPPEMTTAVTPGRELPASIGLAVKTAQPVLVPEGDLVAAMAIHGYACKERAAREVADGKRLVGLLFA
jgi:SAM-dependent methyltransferase